MIIEKREIALDSKVMSGNWVSGKDTVQTVVIPKLSSYPQLNIHYVD